MKVRKLARHEADAIRLSDVLDVLYPYAGPCAVCGGPDKRHRLADAIVDTVRAGDSVAFTASAYALPLAAVERLVADWPAR